MIFGYKKFEIDTTIVINDKVWGIHSYQRKFGHIDGYTLKRLNSSGNDVSMFIEEKALKEIISSSKFIIDQPIQT